MYVTACGGVCRPIHLCMCSARALARAPHEFDLRAARKAPRLPRFASPFLASLAAEFFCQFVLDRVR